MNIGYDAKRAFWNRTGLGNYSRTLLKTLVEHQVIDQAVLFTPKISKNPNTEFLLHPPFQIRQPKTTLDKIFPSGWRTYGLPKEIEKEKVLWYHGLSNELPLNIHRKKIPTIVTIHDLIFERYPEQYPIIDRYFYHRKFKYACQVADKVIAISEQTKQDIIDFYKINPNKIQVVYQSCDAVFYNKKTNKEIQDLKKTHQLPSDFILYVGSIIERKKLLNLVKSLSILMPKVKVPLVVVGQGKDYKEQVLKYINKNNLNKSIVFLDIDFSNLPLLYQAAKAFVYPSVFEGFGIPVLEALHSGIPVITSNVSCLPEAGGPGSCYIDPNSPESIAEGIEKVLTDSELQKDMIAKGLEHAANFLPGKIAGEWKKIYSKT